MKYVIKIYEVGHGECTLASRLYDDKNAAILAGHELCECSNLGKDPIYCYFRVVPATEKDIARNELYEMGYPIYY